MVDQQNRLPCAEPIGRVDRPGAKYRVVAQIENIVAVKEASGSMDQVSDILRLCGDRLTILSGDDALTLPTMALGGKGVVATVSNVMPRETHELAAAGLAGDFARARELHYKLLPLSEGLFV